MSNKIQNLILILEDATSKECFEILNELPEKADILKMIMKIGENFKLLSHKKKLFMLKLIQTLSSDELISVIKSNGFEKYIFC